MTTEQAIECITRALPYPNQIIKWEFEQDKAVRFTWRYTRFRVTVPGIHVEEVKPGILSSGNEAALLEELLKRVWAEMQARESAESGV